MAVIMVMIIRLLIENTRAPNMAATNPTNAPDQRTSLAATKHMQARFCPMCSQPFFPQETLSTCRACHAFIMCLHGNLLSPDQIRPGYKLRVTYRMFTETHDGPCGRETKFYQNEDEIVIDYQVPRLFEKNDFDVDGNLVHKLHYFEKNPVEQCCMRGYTWWRIMSAKVVRAVPVSILDEMFAST